MSRLVVKYSVIDRMVHNLAMGQLELQKSLSRMEDKSFDKTHSDITAANPVFITSLPRAGTTLLLEVIARAPDFVSHTYRDMPFLLCPLLWDRVSRRFRKQAEPRERAHGDGMLIGYDSVEAFEEILWRAFWPEHFEPTRIRPWAPEEEDEDGEFASFLRQHMHKIIGLGRSRAGSVAPRRYVSKNNANIARLGWLDRHFPDATILIPYRDPAGQIASLARQHVNFLEAHAKDGFVLRYMETVGHLEFGRALRPVDFNGWLATASDLDPATLDFWAEYWIVAFGAVLRTAGSRAVVFSYDRLCAAPAAGLEALEAQVGVKAGSFTASAARFRAANTRGPTTDIAPDRARRLEEVLAQLDARALF